MGDRFALVLATEVCARDLQNRLEVGALTGFTPCPLSKRRQRSRPGDQWDGAQSGPRLAVEMAWLWVQAGSLRAPLRNGFSADLRTRGGARAGWALSPWLGGS